MSWLRMFHQIKNMNFYKEICKKGLRKTLARKDKVLKFVSDSLFFPERLLIKLSTIFPLKNLYTSHNWQFGW